MGAVALAGGVVVLVQGVVLALAFQVVPHSGGDNAAYLTLAHSLLERGAYLELWEPGSPPHAKYPPVFPALLATAMALGATTWTAFKGVSALFMALAALLAFVWVAGRRGVLFALGVALLLVISDAFVEAGHWILSEPPFLALTLLSLWAADRAGALPGLRRRTDKDVTGSDPEGGGAGFAPGWVAVAAGAAVLAYFTRSAGLPLVVAVAVWLVLARQWKGASVFGVAFGLSALGWLLRARAVGEDDYATEMWLVDPYQRELGTVGLLDLVGRVVENARIYVFGVFPEGFVGAVGGWAPWLGVALAGLAVVAWGRRVRRGPGLAELFVPLYLGLLLLWPEVWSGDRFALPLYPLLLFYAAETLVDSAGRMGKGWRRGAAVGGVVLIAVPAIASLSERVEVAATCRDAAREHGPYACQPPGMQLFNVAAVWSAGELPDDAAVYSRKPRIFHLLSGIRSRMYPQTVDPEELLAAADRDGVRYAVVDEVDAMSRRYLVPAIQGRPSAFCEMEAWAGTAGAQAAILGIRPARGEERDASAPREGEVPGDDLEACPEAMASPAPRDPPDLTSPVVPILQP